MDLKNISPWKLALALAGIKMLLIPTYHSTDFEVHRNWKAITFSLPIEKWYTEDTSEWTLDYPPFFAMFEAVLSRLALFFDPKMLSVTNLNYASTATILFMRLSVILADLMLIYAVKEYCSSRVSTGKPPSLHQSQNSVLTMLLLCNAGLLLIDHIHFQYNGFLFGLLLLSVARICQGRNLEASLIFATLLNFKHIFLYIAPAYFIYLFRNYCFQSKPDGSIIWTSFSFFRLFSLGAIVITTFAMSFGPFIEQLPQVLSRLFPFKRGLCHAYWAPNFWALYNMADKILTVGGSRLGWTAPHNVSAASMTGGLVQEYEHTVLPSVPPMATLVATVMSILPCLYHGFVYPTGPRGFLRSLVLCAFGSFMFGWHVHEKAVLLMIIPLSILSIEKKKDAQIFLLLSTIGHFSLFPLIFTPAEMPIKYCIFVCYTVFAFTHLGNNFEHSQGFLQLPLLNTMESLYIHGLVPLEVYCSFAHGALGLTARLPFLPLMLISVYCAVGITYTWLKYYWIAVCDRRVTAKVTKVN